MNLDKKAIFFLLVLFTACSVLIYHRYVTRYYQTSSPMKTAESNSQKYLVYNCNGCGGIADRFEGMMTAYALSLMTDRQLIINMSSPCALDYYLLPNEVDWNQQVPAGLSWTKWGGVNRIKQAVDINQLWNNTDVVTMETNIHKLYSLSLNTNYHAKLRELGYVCFTWQIS